MEKNVKISIERYDTSLGWYVAGALGFPLHQLPLLQQALEEMNCVDCPECVETSCRGKIICFPTLMRESSAAPMEVENG